MYVIISVNLKHGILLDQPEAIPVAPFIKNNGTIGNSYYGSIYYPSSLKRY